MSLSERKVPIMNLNHLLQNEKIEDLLAALKKKEDEKEKNTVLWVLAITVLLRSSRYCVCSISFLCSGLSGGFEEEFR